MCIRDRLQSTELSSSIITSFYFIEESKFVKTTLFSLALRKHFCINNCCNVKTISSLLLLRSTGYNDRLLVIITICWIAGRIVTVLIVAQWQQQYLLCYSNCPLLATLATGNNGAVTYCLHVMFYCCHYLFITRSNCRYRLFPFSAKVKYCLALPRLFPTVN